LVPTKLIQ